MSMKKILAAIAATVFAGMQLLAADHLADTWKFVRENEPEKVVEFKLKDDFLDLDTLAAPGKVHDKATLTNEFELEKAEKLYFGIGADWWCTVSLNGKEVFSTYPYGNQITRYSPKNHIFEAEGVPGKNILSIQVERGSGTWSFAFREMGPDAIEPKDPLKGLLPGFKVDYSVPSKAKNYDLSKHPYFEKWVDPESKVTSYVLTKRVAPVQYSFYFTNSSMSADGEYLYFYAAFPPGRTRFVGVVALNPEKPWITWYPESALDNETASPMVAPDSSGVYYFTAERLCFTSVKGETKEIGRIPEEYIRNRHIYWLSTHLSLSADGKWFLVDGKIGDDFFVALMDSKNGEFKLLHEFPYVHDHANFSPVNPKQFLIPRDWQNDPSTGKYEFMESRLYVMDTDQTYYRPLCPDFWESHDGDTAHEWWSQDGIVCFVNYATGVFECNPETREKRHVWKRPICHAHCNGDRTLFCGDQSPYMWKTNPVEVLFFNRLKNEEKHIVTAMPEPKFPRGDYHLDPHPHFSPDGRYIIYMTTVLGNVDVAVTPVEQLR